MAKNNATFLEKTGFWLTFLCAIHCLATPFLLASLPVLGSRFELLHKYEFSILLVSLLLAALLLFKDYKIHKNTRPLLLLLLAMGLKVIEYIFDLHTWELYLTVGISACLCFAYYFNWRHKEACSCEHDH
jgi:hypothetical protein